MHIKRSYVAAFAAGIIVYFALVAIENSKKTFAQQCKDENCTTKCQCYYKWALVRAGQMHTANYLFSQEVTFDGRLPKKEPVCNFAIKDYTDTYKKVKATPWEFGDEPFCKGNYTEAEFWTPCLLFYGETYDPIDQVRIIECKGGS